MENNGKKTKKDTLSERAYKHMLEYHSAYIKDNYKQVLLRFNKESASDVCTMLEQQENVNAYITELIRADIRYKKRKAYRERKKAEQEKL